MALAATSLEASIDTILGTHSPKDQAMPIIDTSDDGTSPFAPF